MILTIFDLNGNNLGYVDKVISYYREAQFNGIGTSEFHLDHDDPILSVLQENQYLILEQDGIFQDIIIGICQDEDLTVYCRSLNWLLSKIVIPPISLSGTISEVISELLSASYGGDIAMGEIPVCESEAAFLSDSALLFSDALNTFLSEENLGHSLRFSHDDCKFYLDIIKGADLDFYVSENDETLDKLTFNYDILNLANSVCFLCDLPVLGTWNPVGNKPVLYQKKAQNMGACYRINTSVDEYSRFGIEWHDGEYIYSDTPDGAWKRSIGVPDDFYIYSSDGSLNKKEQWFYISNKHKPEEASSELMEKIPESRFLATAKNITFLTDYRLGDFVKLQISQGNTVKTIPCQFTQVILSREGMENKENPTLKEVK